MINNVNLNISALVYQAESHYRLMCKYKDLTGEHNKSMYYIFVGEYRAICEIIRICGYIPHIENDKIVIIPVKSSRKMSEVC